MKANDYLLRLKLVRGVGYLRLLQVARCLEADMDIDLQLINQLAINPDLKKYCYQALTDRQIAANARKIKQQCQVLSFFDAEYPQRLREIYQPPLLLFARGELSLLKKKVAVIVGSRTPTDYSQLVIEQIVPQLLAQGYVIASGLARGVDGIAHQETLKNSGSTIAVIGNGLNCFYPWSNHSLQKRISQNGLVLSEYLPDTQPRPFYFPQRNRILAGLSHRVIVTEAKKHSGSLITANIALQENRDIYAVPGRIDSILSQGTNELIAAGAIPLIN